MTQEQLALFQSKCSGQELKKLRSIVHSGIIDFLAEYIELCNPSKIFIRADSDADYEYIRRRAVEEKEEIPLAIEGHTIHFDGYFDQARDKKATKYLLPEHVHLGKLNSIERQEGLAEVKGYLKNCMQGKEAIIACFGLGPLGSEFFIPCVQITDSFYVAHSEGILYRSAFEEIRKRSNDDTFFKFVHTAGELENATSKNIDKRRIYIDLQENTVYSTNTQYAGNTVGLKKLSLRLAIQKSSREGWLAEHMFVMGVCGPNKRMTYFCGAYPSACGKTSTAMIRGQSIVGDDIAYLRKIDSQVRAVNVEKGIFGIIRDVQDKNDPLIWEALTTKGEAIFSNVLMGKDRMPYWLGDGRVHPDEGINFSGVWNKGKIDGQGNQIPATHKNARYTIALSRLKNCDKHLDDPKGVTVGGLIYGGRDSDTWPPVQQAFSWAHGVITMGASLESETTAATLGKEGVRTFNLMSNLDFLSIPFATYIENHLAFCNDIDKVPLIFSANYFLRDTSGKYISDMEDKLIWLKWMEQRVHSEVKAITTPCGLIPLYDDLARLFKEHLGKEYAKELYSTQFQVRVVENLSKIERIVQIYKNIDSIPSLLFETLDEQKQRLLALQKKSGDYVDPFSINV